MTLNTVDYQTYSWYTEPDKSKRISNALADLTDGGVGKAKAISLVAVSVSECAATWIGDRSKATLFNQENKCQRRRPPVGWEGLNVKDSSGAYVKAVPYSILNDPTLKELFLKKGYIGNPFQGENGQPYMRLAGGLLGYDNDAMLELVDYAIINRNRRILANFSLGPTQMYQWWAPVCNDTTDGDTWKPLAAGNRGNDRFFRNWEDVYMFMMSRRCSEAAYYINYLDNPPWPVDDQSERNCTRWLINQCGNDKCAPEYYSKWYRTNLNWTLSEATKLGLI